MLTTVLVVGLGTLALLESGVQRRRGLAAAEAAALGALREMHWPEYRPAPAAGRRAGLEIRVAELARANLPARHPFTLEAGDVAAGPTWVAVRLRAPNRGSTALHALARGVPAGAIAPGRHWLDGEGGVVAAAGCLPLAIDPAPLAPGGPAATGAVRLAMGEGAQAWLVALPGSPGDVASQLRFLGFRPGEPPQGSPPPPVEAGAALRALTPSLPLLADLARLEGRVVIAPLARNGAVAAFARLRLERVDLDEPAVSVSLAPSAVTRSALPGPWDFQVAAARADVSPFGLVLVGTIGS